MMTELIFLPLHLPRQYIVKTKLKRIKYRILEFNPMILRGKVKPDSSRPDLLHPVSSGLGLAHRSIHTSCTDAANPQSNCRILFSKLWNTLASVLQLNFVRFYLPLLDLSHKRVIYLDDDVIVQGMYVLACSSGQFWGLVSVIAPQPWGLGFNVLDFWGFQGRPSAPTDFTLASSACGPVMSFIVQTHLSVHFIKINTQTKLKKPFLTKEVSVSQLIFLCSSTQPLPIKFTPVLTR